MAVSQLPLEPFREIELPDGTDPVEKGIVRRVRERDGTVTVEVAIGGLGERLAERVRHQPLEPDRRGRRSSLQPRPRSTDAERNG